MKYTMIFCIQIKYRKMRFLRKD